jgi:hypothetical protein
MTDMGISHMEALVSRGYTLDSVNFVEDDIFFDWMCQTRNQHFFSLQEAFDSWLQDDGFRALGDDYSTAVQVILVHLSRRIASPRQRRILVNETAEEPEEYATVQVHAPGMGDKQTFWEFFTEEKFHEAYRSWHQSRL